MILSCSEHIERAAYHRDAGEALRVAAGHQWAAVCYFYSAYHLARAALITDPLFGDLGVLKGLDDRLIPDDRFATKHQMRRGSERAFGVNDLMGILYPQIRSAYLELHGASTGVRYGKGISTPVDELKAELDEIEDHLMGHERLVDLRTALERVRS